MKNIVTLAAAIAAAASVLPTIAVARDQIRDGGAVA